MSGRRRVDWPAHVREAIGAELRFSHEAAQAAEVSFKIRVYLAVEQGLTTYELAEELGISQPAVSKDRIQGEAAFERQVQGCSTN
ncbi:hypothetical protein MBT84_29530 [Streptomyces sp. MBT84]|uniref:hypothetical protein n=1 Tax=unclassified Streptomyces TaxID=2593676 RepID=UPI001C6EF81E|nr:hypothetical protein [Streptomyces sp. MBT84]MBW8703743.1 hypothetical protein [Streptomyces sp. MBT84]